MTDTRRILLKESIERFLDLSASMNEVAETVGKIRDAEMVEYDLIPEEEHKTQKAEDLSNRINSMDNIIDAINELETLEKDLEYLRRA